MKLSFITSIGLGITSFIFLASSKPCLSLYKYDELYPQCIIDDLSRCRIRADASYILNCCKLGHAIFSLCYLLGKWDPLSPFKVTKPFINMSDQEKDIIRDLEIIHAKDNIDTENNLRNAVIDHWINFKKRYSFKDMSMCSYHDLRWAHDINMWEKELQDYYKNLLDFTFFVNPCSF